jgi:hypothetical protein
MSSIEILPIKTDYIQYLDSFERKHPSLTNTSLRTIRYFYIKNFDKFNVHPLSPISPASEPTNFNKDSVVSDYCYTDSGKLKYLSRDW